MVIKYKRLYDDVKHPVVATEGSAGIDIHAYTVEETMPEYYPKPQKDIVIQTGLAFEIPRGYVMLIYPRSGLSVKTGMRFINTTPVIDSDYRGEVTLRIERGSKQGAVIKPGDRVAQAVVVPYINEIKEVKELNQTKRGESGWGSTGA